MSVLVWSPLRVTHTGLPQRFNLNFPISIPVTFIWESPLGFLYCRSLCYCFVAVNIITDEGNFHLIFAIPFTDYFLVPSSFSLSPVTVHKLKNYNVKPDHPKMIDFIQHQRPSMKNSILVVQNLFSSFTSSFFIVQTLNT